MTDHHQVLARVGVRVPDVLLPKPGTDLQAWAVVACDQFTSQRDYWNRVDVFVGDKPSTLRLIFPEAFLDEAEPQRRVAAINAAMRGYVDAGLFDEHRQTMVLVRREDGHGLVRWGLVVALDLEAYDWHAGSRTLIRATEGTIEDRIPPRKLIRRDAPLELPHIMVLISDPARSVIEPLAARADGFVPLYDTDLMQGGGHITGWAVRDEADLDAVAVALGALRADLDDANPLLFAMGDGNHSFATAKSIWTDVKATLPEDQWEGHPARYALVEVENIFDAGLEFEPIHRVLFGLSREAFEAELARHCSSFAFTEATGPEAALAAVADSAGQAFAYADADGAGVYTLIEPEASIPAGTIQRLIDALVGAGACEVDYIHGTDVTADLARRPGNVGVFLPPIPKDTFFASIVADGALPRKTFSLGHAEDKRYYLEARAIK